MHRGRGLTQNDLEKLIQQYALDARLAELQELTREADERQERAYAPEAPELKDVWRPDLDITTAIRARIAADSEPRVARLRDELAEVRCGSTADDSCALPMPRRLRDCRR